MRCEQNTGRKGCCRVSMPMRDHLQITPAVKERKKKQKARYNQGWGSSPSKKAPPEAKAPPTPQTEEVPELDEELRAATYHPRDGYLVDGSKASSDELVWCFRRGQRLALVAGRMPHERVRAICTVVAYANGTYACVCDDGEGITLDPTGHRTRTLEIPLDKKRVVRGLQRTEIRGGAGAGAVRIRTFPRVLTSMNPEKSPESIPAPWARNWASPTAGS